MPIDRIRSETISLMLNGDKEVTIKARSKLNSDFNKALLDPKEFRNFALNPREFAARFDIRIDNEIANQLITKLDGFSSLEEVQKYVNPGDEVGATVWAVAAGSYSVASSKV